jgi:hypothetical protein
MATYAYRRKHPIRPTLDGSDTVGPHWSLWRSPRPPAGLLAVGDHVILVDNWRGQSRVTWDLVVNRVEHGKFATKREAMSALARAFDLSMQDLLADAYLAQKGDGAAVLLAWTGRPVRQVDLPRPAELTFARHGWASVKDADAIRWWGTEAVTAPVEDAAPADPADGENS